MKAARWHAREDVRIEEMQVPEPGPGEVLLKVAWCGICGTDMEEYLHGPSVISTAPHPLTGSHAPLALGHEFSGEVAALGPGVRSLAVGERVAAETTIFCGSCYFCRRREFAFCTGWGTIGFNADGGLAEYAVVPAFSSVRVPDTVSDEQAALAEPIAVAVRAIRRGRVVLGDTVCVLGCGTIGLLCVQVARAAGARRVLAIDVEDARLELAARLGADHTLSARSPDLAAAAHELLGGIGPDVVLECAGATTTGPLAVQVVRKGGRVVLVGVCPHASQFTTLDIVLGEKEILGSVANDYELDLALGVDLLARGRVVVEPLITRRIGLGEIVERGLRALQTERATQLKILVSPQL
jgi:(R,R)-butanediol dehydrogenase / meso-butanediol dehydrogenase / diacetyl reductase